ncbi:hypothetical protein HNQ94_002896 [Salirhabdus euzebyi]|uniref:YaaC-like Protein n=1 Tax=Salirhabdus euzebyi TaxID=394506 RepID=A0A841Q7W4_9BACI|nr:YaaC family protein [Salirhabdus euzebyi]MBB6454414.1 hypothetical protein [Salirhabdus euzebyi]
MVQQQMNAFFDQLKSIPYVQMYLKNCYKKQEIEDADRLSFENAERFIYYLEHAETYFQQSKQAPISIKPVLLFYGLTQLIKTCLIACRPQYPENTRLLAHGVSARKRKKQNYSFLQDEVKIQQYGLFPYFSNHLFSINQFPTDKFSMDVLLKKIPEMDELNLFQNKETTHEEIFSNEIQKELRIPLTFLNDWHMTENRFIEKIKLYLPEIEDVKNTDNHLVLSLEKNILPFENSLFSFHIYKEKWFLSKKRKTVFPFHEVMTHYLLLYNLSMICRYETEWWGDLLHTYGSNDYSYIKRFVDIAETKTPIMLGYFLLNMQRK